MELTLQELKQENYILRKEIEALKFEIKVLKENDWKHPQSCIGNCDPWATWI